MKIKLTIIIPVFNQEELIIKALDSIPLRDDFEILIIDDCSTDSTLKVVRDYQMNSEKNIAILRNDKNMGVGFSVNKGYDYATGEYVVLLGSDDYFYTDKLDEIVNELDGTDLIYFDLETNDGTIFYLDEYSKWGLCGSVKFMRREFIKGTRCRTDIKAGEDWYFFRDLMKLNPTEKFTNKIIKHYNFPRVNSLSDLLKKGKL